MAFVYAAIFARDDHTCQYCGAAGPDVELQVDHVVPASKGGGDEPTNLVTACRSCNRRKGSGLLDSLPATVTAALRRPYAPEKHRDDSLVVRQFSGEIRDRAKIVAVQQKITLKELVTRALLAYLAEHEQEQD